MMKRVLFIANIDRHILCFHLHYLKFFKDKGWEVNVAAHKLHKEEIPYCDNFIEVPFSRSIFSVKNILAYYSLKKIIRHGGYHIIHTHTPIASAISRLAAKSMKEKGVKVIYTAHGFHFYNGAPLINWCIFYPIEKYLSKFTDCMVTINREDYARAIKNKFNSTIIEYVDGIGIDNNKFVPVNRERIIKFRREMDIAGDSFVITCIGELTTRKNQTLIIESFPKIVSSIPNAILLIVGDGSQENKLKKKVNQLGLIKSVKFLGYRKEVDKIIALSDIGVSASKYEGLPVNIMEFMASGKPVVASNCRGNRDLVQHGTTGFLFNSQKEFTDSIIRLSRNVNLRLTFGIKSKETIEQFSIQKTIEQHKKIYNKFMI